MLLEIAFAAAPLLALFVGSALVLLAGHWLAKPRPPALPPPPPPSPPPPVAHPSLQQAARRVEQEVERARREETRARKEAERRAAEAEAARRQEEARVHLARLCSEVTSHVTFTAKRVQVGVRKTGERAVGVTMEEVGHPADDIDIRPLRDGSEIGSVLAAELVHEDDVFFARLAASELQVSSHIAHVPVFEDVHEPVWEERRRILYVLFDRSGSMVLEHHGGAWRVPIWQGIISALIVRARQAEALYLMREFTQDVAPLVRVATDEEADQLIRSLYQSHPGGGTNIGVAIAAAIADLAGEDYDQADIVIVTDGEDEGSLDPLVVRPQLTEANIRLHAVLLGVKNDALRQCADLYQIVNRDGSLQPLVRRA